MDSQVSKDLFQINVGERAVLAPLEVHGTGRGADLIFDAGGGPQLGRVGQRTTGIFAEGILLERVA